MAIFVQVQTWYSRLVWVNPAQIDYMHVSSAKRLSSISIGPMDYRGEPIETLLALFAIRAGPAARRVITFRSTVTSIDKRSTIDLLIELGRHVTAPALSRQMNVNIAAVHRSRPQNVCSLFSIRGRPIPAVRERVRLSPSATNDTVKTHAGKLPYAAPGISNSSSPRISSRSTYES